MFGWIGRRSRVANARAALRAVVESGGDLQAQLSAIRMLEAKDRRIHSQSVLLLQAGNVDRAFKLFDSVAPPPPGAQPPPSAGPGAAGAPGGRAWDDLDFSGRMAVIIAEASKSISDPEVRAPYHATDTEARWRFRAGGRPFELEIDDDGDAEVRLRHLNRRGYFAIRKGDAQLPRAGAGAWSDPLDLVQLQVGDDLWLVGLHCFLEDDQRTWLGLPDALRAAIQAALSEGLISQLLVNSPVIEAYARLAPESGRSISASLGRIYELLGSVAETMGEGASLVPPRSSTVFGGQLARPPAELLTCTYCGTEHYRDVDPRCPSCGAPRTA